MQDFLELEFKCVQNVQKWRCRNVTQASICLSGSCWDWALISEIQATQVKKRCVHATDEMYFYSSRCFLQIVSFFFKRSVGDEIQCKLASLQCRPEDWLGTLDYWLASKCPSSSPPMCPPCLSELGSRCANEPKRLHPHRVTGFVVQMFISIIKWALLAERIVFVKILICVNICACVCL